MNFVFFISSIEDNIVSKQSIDINMLENVEYYSNQQYIDENID
jgi:hypothetical protein